MIIVASAARVAVTNVDVRAPSKARNHSLPREELVHIKVSGLVLGVAAGHGD